jgi:selenide,water dikinase
LLTDPQTSGGLLIACAPDSVDEVLAAVCEVQGNTASVIGGMEAGASLLHVV